MPDDSVLLGELAEEFTARVRRGEMPAVEEYADRYPALAERIRALFPTLLLLEGMAAGGAAASPAAPGADLAPGSTFGGYRIVREVGRGGMGVVYEAVHLALQRRVALKVLPLRGPGAAPLERFFREARTAAGLHHTNIVPVFDVGQAGGTPYYAMQFIDGASLDRSGPAGPQTAELAPGRTVAQSAAASGAPAPAQAPVEPHPPATPPPGHYRWVAEVGVQAAEALAYAHAREVIHRDIKPSNLLLDREGVVWVTDFGLARRPEDVALTHPGQLVGTPRYMSPEQAEAAKRPVDSRTDVYSLGATLYELLTRRPPFDGPTPLDVVLQILERAPVAPRRLDPQVPRDLETVILKAMAKPPQDRYQTAQELAEDLRRFLNGEPIKARRIGPLGRTVRWARRNPVIAALVAAVFLALVAGTGVSALFAVRARDQAREAEAARQKADRQAERNERLLYIANLNLAQAAFNEQRLPRARELLNEIRPREGKDDLRGWEWHYLWGNLHKAVRTKRAIGRVMLGEDGSRLLSVFSGTTVVQDRISGRPLLRLPRAAETIPGISPDGRVLAEVDGDALTVYEVDSGRKYGPFRLGKRMMVRAVGPDRVALEDLSWLKPSGGDLPHGREIVLEIRELKTGRLRHTLKTGPTVVVGVPAARFSADGRSLALLTVEQLRVWDTDSGAARLTVERQVSVDRPLISDFHAEAALDRRGKQLAFVEGGGKVIGLWDTATGKRVRELSDFPGPARALCFSPDGGRLAVALEGGGVRILDLADREAPQTLFCSDGTVEELAFRGDGLRLVGVHRGTPLEWDLTRPDRVRLPGLDMETFLLVGALSPDGRRLAALVWEGEWGVSARALLKVWGTQTGRVIFERPLGAVEESLQMDGALLWSPNGRVLALFRPEPAALRGFRLPVPGYGLGGLLPMTAVPRRPTAYQIRLWRFDGSGQNELTLPAPAGGAGRITFSPDGRLLLSADNTGWVLWEAATGKRVGGAPTGTVPDYLTFSPDGRLIAVLSHPQDVARDPFRHELTLWDTTTGQLVARPAVPPVYALGRLTFHPNGKTLALPLITPPTVAGGVRRVVHVWEEERRWAGRELFDVPRDDLTPNDAIALTFRNDGRRLALGLGKRVLVYDLAAGRVLHTLAGHSGVVRDVRFDPAGDRLFVVSKMEHRQELKVWDADAGRELLTLPLQPSFDHFARPLLHFDGPRLVFPGWNPKGLAEVTFFDGTPAAAGRKE